MTTQPALSFTLTLSTAEAVVDEPVRASFCLAATSAAIDAPFSYKSTDVVSLELCDEGGELLERADGYTKKALLGVGFTPEPHASMQTMRIEPGEKLAWDEPLVRYFGSIAPGSYLVRARFRFEPKGVDHASEPVALTVRPHRCAYLDVVSDRVLLATTTMLSQHRGADEVRTFARIARTASPGAFWEGASLPVHAGAEARISEADFTTTETFAHDFARTIAWVDRDSGSLSFTSFVESGAATDTVTVALGLRDASMIGRPIRHADGSFTVLLTSGDARASRVVQRAHVDLDGTIFTQEALVTLDEGSEPLTAVPDGAGGIYLLTVGAPDRLPILLAHRDAEGSLVLGEIVSAPDDVFVEEQAAGRPREPRLLGARLLVKAHLGPRAALLAFAVDHASDDPNQDDLVLVVQAFLDEPPAGLPQTSVRRVTLPRGTLARGEAPIAADLARTHGRDVHALVATSRGRLLHVRPDGRASWPASMPPDRARQIALVATPEHDVFAYFASDDVGIDELVLASPPRP